MMMIVLKKIIKTKDQISVLDYHFNFGLWWKVIVFITNNYQVINFAPIVDEFNFFVYIHDGYVTVHGVSRVGHD